MAELANQVAAFSCLTCRKHFEQEASWKRHVRRCRRKQPTPPRQKSCSQCVTSKARCTLEQPSCSRCSAKNLRCRYPFSTAKDDSNVLGSELGGKAFGISTECFDTLPSTGTEASWGSLPTFHEGPTALNSATVTPLGELPFMAVGSTLSHARVYPNASTFGSGPTSSHGAITASCEEASVITSGTRLPSISPPSEIPGTNNSTYQLETPNFLSPLFFTSETPTLSEPSSRTLPYLHSELKESKMPIAILGAPSPSHAEDDKYVLTGEKLSRIRDRWGSPFFKPPSTKPSVNKASVGFMAHVLKTYPKMMARDGGLAPIIHRLQSTRRAVSSLLKDCRSWTRIWEHRTDNSEMVLLDAMQDEFGKLYRDHRSYDLADMLAALQASLIYSIMIHLDSKTTGQYAVQLVLGQLQEMAYHLLMAAAISTADIPSKVPDLESWVIASAAHRTVLAIYVFDCVVCFLHHIPVYTCDELDFIPAPVCRRLWEAGEYETWREEYANWTKLWNGREVVMGELLNRYAVLHDCDRVEKWISEADEFGMLIFAGSLLSLKNEQR